MTKHPTPITIVLDVRCLQDENYARRGIGRHALALLRHAPRGPDAIRLIGLADPDMPPLLPEAREPLDDLCWNAYAAGRLLAPAGLGGFVAMSPMTHSPLFTARLLDDPGLSRMAVIYDFIPRRFPSRYLPGAEHRLAYATALRWLARFDRFAPISHSAADDLVALFGVSRQAITVTGAPLDPLFERKLDGIAHDPPRHMLFVGGGDPRKNAEVLIRAHARCAAMQAGAGIPLVLAGNYGPIERDAFRTLAVAAGGRAELVEVPGHVGDEALLDLYGAAFAVICASRDEGFSLPVVEGMAAGLPCLVSDIPAHRELVPGADQRFAPDDDAALTAALTRVLDPGWRDTVLARQADVWPRFRACRVAQRFWGAVLAAGKPSLAAPAVSRGRRPKVALLSPLPPDRSGVADYTAASCGELARLVDLCVFSETASPAALPGAGEVRALGALPHLLPGFDRVVSVIGNSHFHLRIFEMLRRYGGACIAHDARMLGFYCVLLGQERAREVASRELGRPVAPTEIHGWLADEARLEALFLGEIAESAAPTIVHSPVTAEQFPRRYGKPAHYVPFSIYRPWSSAELTAPARAAARARLGIAPGEVAIASFGFIHASKAPEECIWALDVLRGWNIPACLRFVGGTGSLPDGGAALRALAARLGLSSSVRFGADFVSEQDYRDHLVGADLAVQLRTYGLGGLSGALLDCVAAGLPTVTNAALAAAVGVPSGYTRAIPDALSPLLLAEALADLRESRATEAHVWATEREAYSRERSLASYARGLCRALDLDVTAGSASIRPRAA